MWLGPTAARMQVALTRNEMKPTPSWAANEDEE